MQELTKTVKKYYTDIVLPEMQYGVLIRSPISSGTIRSISHPKLPENYTIITARDIPGKNLIETNNIQTPILAYEKVSYVGEPIGILVGEDRIKLYELLNEIEIKYTEATETPEVLANQTNIIASRTSYFGDSELLYTSSEIQIVKDYTSKLQFTKSKEPLGAICHFSKKHFKIYAPTQWAYHLRMGICNVMDCDKNDITIIKTITDNNATNSLWRTSILACQAAIASKIIGKPVKIILSTHEQENYVDSPIIVHTNFQTALEKDGTIKAMNADVKVDCGAFCPFAQDILDRMVIALSSMYRYQSFSITAHAETSHQPPLSADLHLTDFLAFFSLENMMQEISEKLKIFPNELREKNIIDNKLKNNYPFLIDSTPLKDVLDKAVTESSFLRKHVAYGLHSNSFDFTLPLKGIGLSSAFEGSGFYGANVNKSNLSMEVTLEKDGSVLIKSPYPSDAIFEIWKNIVNELIETDKDKIFIDEDSLDTLEPVLPNISVHNISILTCLLRKCCNGIKKQLFRSALPISVKKSIGTNKNKKWDSTEFTGEPFHSTAWASAVTEIEVDPCTFMPKILGIWIAAYGGQILNKTNAEHSIKKATYQTLMHSIPGITLKNIPIHIYFIESKKEAKEIGDLVYNAIPASITNALSLALKKDITVLPLLPDAIYYALNEESSNKESDEGVAILDENQI